EKEQGACQGARSESHVCWCPSAHMCLSAFVHRCVSVPVCAKESECVGVCMWICVHVNESVCVSVCLKCMAVCLWDSMDMCVSQCLCVSVCLLVGVSRVGHRREAANCHKLRSLEQGPNMISQFSWVRIPDTAYLVLCVGPHGASIMVWLRAAIKSEAWGLLPSSCGCWQMVFPGNYRTHSSRLLQSQQKISLTSRPSFEGSFD
uniref:Uncharacterized protein n=1 Tax=Marmota marmota marmota TaxID=9994 RepID=A0A8C5YYR6_MARMA